METVTISTHLDHFLMPDKISHISADEIRVVKHITKTVTPLFIIIETLAQTGAFHVRYLNEFKKHAFLLSILNVDRVPVTLEPGDYTIVGHLESRSKDAFAYELCGENEGHRIISGRFLFAVVGYNRVFHQNDLEDHYREVFSCLTNDTVTD